MDRDRARARSMPAYQWHLRALGSAGGNVLTAPQTNNNTNVLIEIDERHDVVVVNTLETGNQGVTKISKCLLHVHVLPQYFPLRFMSVRKLEELCSIVLLFLFLGPKIVNFIEPSQLIVLLSKAYEMWHKAVNCVNFLLTVFCFLFSMLQ